MEVKFDVLDCKILVELIQNVCIFIVELVCKVGLLKILVLLCICQMEEMGLIIGYCVMLLLMKLGLINVIYVEVSMSDICEVVLQQFNIVVCVIFEVEECYMIVGGCDYFLKVWLCDMMYFCQIFVEWLLVLLYVSNIFSYVLMEVVVEQNFVLG